MTIRLLSSAEDLARYDAWLQAHPQGSLWQSLEWKRYQEGLGRQTRIYAALEGQTIAASALAIIDRTSFGLSVWDIPRGPLTMENGKWKMENFVEQIIMDARKDNCMALFASPPIEFSIFHFPFSISRRHEQPEATIKIDLTQSEDSILSQMHQKGRYNIRVAQKHGVRTEQSQNIGAFYGLLQESAQRDGFTERPQSHYQRFLENLPGTFLLLAYGPDNLEKPIAGLLGVIWGKEGIYYYGGSSYASRALMGPYLLQWEAMRLCQAKNCRAYDLLGIAPEGESNHPWAGVTNFKRKFGGTVVSYPSEQQLLLRPLTYKVLQLKRRVLR